MENLRDNLLAQAEEVPVAEAVPFQREGNFVLFNQYGRKLEFSDQTPNDEYYRWLDSVTAEIGQKVPGAKIVEKQEERTAPRHNTGIYYDTVDYRLLRSNMVLRTTCNPKTHAFCAFKLGEDEQHTRRDHRHIFDGPDKLTIQRAPESPDAVAAVMRLLSRDDIAHPGVFLRQRTGIVPKDLSPAVRLGQDRRTFYAWLDGSDALRCSLDRVQAADLRAVAAKRTCPFSEIEIAIYPRIAPAVARDPRLNQLIEVLCESVMSRFGVGLVSESKYRRAALALELGVRW